MSRTEPVTIEENQRLSNSIIWEGQRAYYHQQGAQAWAGDVPFYITSNPVIANCYANLIVRFIQDWSRQNPKSKKEPFYIIELGTGSGQFTYYVLKRLSEIKHQLKLDDLNFCYVMTDFTENNLKFWEEHAALKPYFETGALDYAIYDLEKDTSITLRHSQKILAPNTLSNPLIVVANYIFDSVISDVFTAKEGALQESLVSISTTKSNIQDNLPIKWDKIDLSFTDKLIDDHYFENEAFNRVLAQYRHALKDSSFLFPTGALQGISNLQKLANGKLFLISSDKGFNTLRELEDLAHPDLDFHGSFSVMVNYHAIAAYFKQSEGDAFLQTPRDGIATGIFASGMTFDQLPEVSQVLHRSIEGFSPADYFNLYEYLSENYEKCDSKTLASLLSLSNWDPSVFEQVSSHIIENIENADEDVIHYLAKNMPLLAQNLYIVPGCDDTYFTIALFFYEIDDFEASLSYYTLSEKHFGEDHSTTYNMGLCYFHLQNYEQALSTLKRALQLKPSSKETKEQIKKTKKELEKQKVA